MEKDPVTGKVIGCAIEVHPLIFCAANVPFLETLPRIGLRRFFTTKSTKIMKNGQNIHENSFVRFVSFVVKLIYGCGPSPQGILGALRGGKYVR
jgi:hypothetical protein